MSVREEKAVEFESVFFERRVIFSTPDEKYIAVDDVKDIVEETFAEICSKYGLVSGDENVSIDTEMFIADVKEYVFAEVIQAYEANTEETGDSKISEMEAINSAVDSVFPDNISEKELPSQIMSIDVAAKVIRIGLQAVFEELRDKQTCMGVEYPFDFQSHQWGEGVSIEGVTELDRVESDEVIAGKLITVLVVNCEFFENPVVMPAPSDVYLQNTERVSVCDRVFSSIIEYGNENIVTGRGYVETTAFAAKLKQVVHDVLIDESQEVTVQEEDRIITSLNSTFPPKELYDELPSKIYRIGVLVYITRGVVQTVFDKLHTWETNLRVFNPFIVENKRWNDVYIEKNTIESKTEDNENGGVLVSEFDFSELDIGDMVNLSSIQSTLFEVTRVELDDNLRTSSGDFQCDGFAYLSCDSDAVSNRVVVENKVGMVSVWRITNSGVADRGSSNRDVRIQVL